MPATLRNAKICYLEMPARDTAASAEFYHGVFGWPLRHRHHGSISFDDTVAGVTGAFVPDREPTGTAGLIVYVMVRDACTACEPIVTRAAEIVRPIDSNSKEITAVPRSWRQRTGSVRVQGHMRRLAAI